MTTENITKMCIEHHTTEATRKELKERYGLSSMYMLDHTIRVHSLDPIVYAKIALELNKQ